MLRQEEEEVLKEIQSVRAALSQEDALQERLKEQAGVSLRSAHPPPASPVFR